MTDGAKPLKREFADCLRASVETQERLQILSNLQDARVIIAGDDIVRAVHDILDQDPHSVEANLDLLTIPNLPATWVEIDDRARRARDVALKIPEGTARIGYLLTLHPTDPGIIIAAVARRIPERNAGECHLLPSLIAINTGLLAEQSFSARRFYSRQRDESLARMMMELHTYIPAGFVPEFEVMERLVENFDPATEGMKARLDASGEGVFLLGLLLAIGARHTVRTSTGNETSISLASPQAPGWRARAAAALFRTPPAPGFTRREKRSGTWLELLPGKAA